MDCRLGERYRDLTELSSFEKLMTGRKQVKDEGRLRRIFTGTTKERQEKRFESDSFSFRVCTKPLSRLTRICVDDLRVNIPADGSYLLLRTMEKPVKGKYVVAFGFNTIVLVQDHTGSLTVCCLYGHVFPYSTSPAKEELSVDTVFVLKEPCLKACSSEHFAVVVGSPSDFLIVGRSHVLSTDVELLGWRETPLEKGVELASKWKSIGNELYKAGKHVQAVDAYQFALNGVEGESETSMALQLNLSAACLALGRYEAAIKHALKARLIDSRNERALYLAGRGYYELRNYRDAVLCFRDLLHEHPSNSKAQSEFSRCIVRVRESQGYLDFHKLINAQTDNTLSLVENGDYVGPIQYESDPGGQMRVIAKKDINAGTLVVMENALAAVISPSDDRSALREKLLHAIIRAVLDNPKTFGKIIYSLPTGEESFDRNTQLFCDQDAEVEPIVDVLRLHEIKSRYHKLSGVEKPSPSSWIQTHQHFFGVSFFQHKCLPNCTIRYFKNVATVQACSFIAKGEVLTLCHFSNDLPYPEKLYNFRLRAIKCDCALCALDGLEADAIHQTRDELFNEIKLLQQSCNAEQKMLRIAENLERTYGRRSSLRTMLFPVFLHIAKAVNRKGHGWPVRVKKYVDKGLESVGLSAEIILKCFDQPHPDVPNAGLFPEFLLEYVMLMVEVEKEQSAKHPVATVLKWCDVLIGLSQNVYHMCID